MTNARKPILLLGAYGYGNVGDDAFLVAAMRHFPADAPLFLNSADDGLLPKAIAGRTQTVSTSTGSDLMRKLRIFRQVKHIVYCGGDLWVELYGDRFPRKSLYKMLAINMLARATGKKVHYLGCGIGDLHGYSLRLARMSAGLAHTLVLREPRSARVLALRRGVVLPDLVSSLDWPADLPERAPGKPFTIGISILYHLPNPQRTFPQLVETLRAFVASLPQGQFRVVLFPMLVSPADPKDDLWASRHLQMVLGADADVTISAARELEDVVRELQDVDLLIGTRLHANILALFSGTPCLGIAYRPKVQSFFDANGLGDYCLDLAHLTPESLRETFWAMHDAYPAVRKRFLTVRRHNTEEGASYQTFISRHF